MIRRLWASTIWHPDAIPASEGEVARDVKRWVLPLIDAALILGSILGLNGGMPTFAIVYNETVSQVASVAVLLAAIGWLIGVALPRLWRSRSTRSVSSATSEYPARGFIAGVCAAVTALPVWRIIWLGREYRRRRGPRKKRTTTR